METDLGMDMKLEIERMWTYFNLLRVQADLTSNLTRGHGGMKSPKGSIVVHLSNWHGLG